MAVTLLTSQMALHFLAVVGLWFVFSTSYFDK